MSIAQDIQAWRIQLNIAVDTVMQSNVADAAKKAITEAAEKNVYSYEPEFYSRRRESGGLIDEENMKTHYDSATKTLDVTDEAPWQQLYGGDTPSMRLAEAIEDGTYMYGAGARPFFDDADGELSGSHGKAEQALVEGLSEMGYTVR